MHLMHASLPMPSLKIFMKNSSRTSGFLSVRRRGVSTGGAVLSREIRYSPEVSAVAWELSLRLPPNREGPGWERRALSCFFPLRATATTSLASMGRQIMHCVCACAAVKRFHITARPFVMMKDLIQSMYSKTVYASQRGRKRWTSLYRLVNSRRQDPSRVRWVVQYQIGKGRYYKNRSRLA